MKLIAIALVIAAILIVACAVFILQLRLGVLDTLSNIFKNSGSSVTQPTSQTKQPLSGSTIQQKWVPPGFIGPSGQPQIIGPSGPPPNY